MREAQEAARRKPKNLFIRNFKNSDETKVMNIFKGTNADIHCFLPQDVLDKQRKDCKDNLSCEKTWVVGKGREIIGFISLINANKIAGIYVKKSHIGKGYGKHLLNYIKSLKDTLELAVYENNENALSFYINQGFKEVRNDMDNGFKYLVLRWDKNG